MENQDTQALNYWLIVLGLSIAALFVLLWFVSMRTQGDTTNNQTTTTTIANEDPIISGFEVRQDSSGGTLISNGGNFTAADGQSTELHMNFTITDDNGCEQFWDDATRHEDAEIAVLFAQLDSIDLEAEGPCGSGTSENSNTNECFIDWVSSAGVEQSVFSCSVTEACSDSLDNSMALNCSIDLPFFADTDDWVALVNVTDGAEGEHLVSSTVQVSELIGLSITNSSIPYGVLALGATSTEVGIQITNTGNETLQPRVRQTDFVCDTGGIVAGATKVASSSGLTYANMPQLLTTSLADIGGYTINDRDLNMGGYGTDVSNTSSVYLKLQVPTTGARGSCTATTTFQAASGS